MLAGWGKASEPHKGSLCSCLWRARPYSVRLGLLEAIGTESAWSGQEGLTRAYPGLGFCACDSSTDKTF
jgi:hypothetical protein